MQDSKWYYGSYNEQIGDIIANDKSVYIDRNTVCRCIGIQDSIHADIYENDIVENIQNHYKYYIFWKPDTASFVMQSINDNEIFTIWKHTMSYGYKVIGNKFDNPDMMIAHIQPIDHKAVKFTF